MQPTRLFLIRHGETTANVAGRMQGRGNDPLTPRGQRQVQAVAERLAREQPPITALYASPLLRARLTAEAIAARLGVPVRFRDGLQEMHLGALEGVSAEELLRAAPRDPDQAYPGGESAREFVERIMGTLYGIVAAHPGEAIAAVSHGGVISTALAIWSEGHGAAWTRYAPANCALSIIEFEARPRIVLLNDCAHLEL